MESIANVDGVSGFATNDTKLVFQIIMADVSTKFDASVLLMTNFFTVIADYHASPDAVGGGVAGSLTVVTITRSQH